MVEKRYYIEITKDRETWTTIATDSLSCLQDAIIAGLSLIHMYDDYYGFKIITKEDIYINFKSRV